jgi:hypothetical protein
MPHSIPDERLRRVKQVYQDALDVPPARRAAFLAEACGGDRELQREVLELFLMHGQLDEWLDRPLDGAEALADLASPREGFIGPYRLVRQLGRGGMSVVHLAEREGQTVALKLLAAGSLSPELREQFRSSPRSCATWTTRDWRACWMRASRRARAGSPSRGWHSSVWRAGHCSTMRRRLPCPRNHGSCSSPRCVTPCSTRTNAAWCTAT